MTNKTYIQTNLLGKTVTLSETGIQRWPADIGKQGTIASVYLDEDNHPKYTIRLNEGKLLDMYSHDFVI